MEEVIYQSEIGSNQNLPRQVVKDKKDERENVAVSDTDGARVDKLMKFSIILMLFALIIFALSIYIRYSDLI